MTDAGQKDEELNRWWLITEDLHSELQNRKLNTIGEANDLRIRLADALYVERGIDDATIGAARCGQGVRYRLSLGPFEISAGPSRISAQDARSDLLVSNPSNEPQISAPNPPPPCENQFTTFTTNQTWLPASQNRNAGGMPPTPTPLFSRGNIGESIRRPGIGSSTPLNKLTVLQILTIDHVPHLPNCAKTDRITFPRTHQPEDV